VDGFLTEGGRTTPSELAKDRESGMLSLACDRAQLCRVRPGSGWTVGFPTVLFFVSTRSYF